jgi:capsule polysaccharide export protein KpsC/LpsZ
VEAYAADRIRFFSGGAAGLVAKALILSPVYVAPVSRQLCTAEYLLEWLARLVRLMKRLV